MDPQKMSRAVFARQPAHVLLVDFSPPFDIDTCHTLHRTLENFFSLVCNLGGPCRTPLFGLYALGCYPECLFPLQHVRGSFPRLYTAFSELKNYLSDGNGIATKNYNCIVQGVREAVLQFNRQSQTFRQVAGFSCQLEVTIITAHQAPVISKHIETVTGTMDLENLKKIQVVSVSDPNNLILAEDELFDGSQNSNTTSTSSDNAICSIIDLINIDNDELSLENFFKSWLHDCGTDREHLHLSLPSVSMISEDGSKQEKLTLKCDLHERIINPSQLPFQAQYSLHMDAVNAKPIMSSAVNKGSGPVVPIQRLRAVKLIKSDSICESVLYGMPLIVRPTACWKLDWEELDTNQQNFQALCQLLQDKELFLLAKMEETEERPKPNSFNYRPNPPKPSGHFLLLPSQSMTLLIKSVAVSELMLPCDFQVPTDKPLSDAINLLSDSLTQLEVDESFNPLLSKSHLCRSLTSSLMKNINTSRQQKRKPSIYDSQTSQPTSQWNRGKGRGGRGSHSNRGQTKSQYPPLATHPTNRTTGSVPSQQKRYCPPPPPLSSSQDIYAFQDFDDFPTEL